MYRIIAINYQNQIIHKTLYWITFNDRI